MSVLTIAVVTVVVLTWTTCCVGMQTRTVIVVFVIILILSIMSVVTIFVIAVVITGPPATWAGRHVRSSSSS